MMLRLRSPFSLSIAFCLTGCLESDGGLGATATDSPEFGGTLTTDDAGVESSTGDHSNACDNQVIAEHAANYALDMRFRISAATSVQPNAVLDFDWAMVSNDLVGLPLDSESEIELVWLAVWTLTLPELEQRLENDSLQSGDLVNVVTFAPELGRTSASLLDFALLGNPVAPDELLQLMDAERYPSSSFTHTISVQTSTTVGVGVRMIAAFRLDETSSNTKVQIMPSSADVELGAALAGRPPLAVPQGNAAVWVDWSSLASDAFGRPLDPTSVTRVRVARFDHSVAELEASFVELESLAEGLWQAENATDARILLSDLVSSEGEPFPGIDETGTWLIALECPTCRGRVPPYLAVLDPC